MGYGYGQPFTPGKTELKVLFINPPHDNSITSEVPTTVNAETNTMPPLGLLYLEASLHAYTDSQTLIIDCLGEHKHLADIEKLVEEENPDIAAVTGHTHDLIDMLSVSSAVRRVSEGRCKIWWGGPHVSDFPSECMRYDCVDGCIPFEGEEAFAETVKACQAALNNGIWDEDELERGLRKVDGIYFKNARGNTESTKARSPIANLDSLPFPRREILDIKNYSYILGAEATATSLITSRGCPYKCSFCNTPGRSTWRWRSAESIVREIEECVKLGIREIYVVDDTFNVRKDRVISICDAIKKRGLKVNWNIRARANCLTPETVKAMKDAGCTHVHIGVESGSDAGMKALKKNLTTAIVRQAFQILKDEGITTVCYFMIGCPHEKTRDDIKQTIDFAIELDPAYALFGILTPYPNTAIYDQGVKAGILDPEHWKKFLENPTPDFKPQVWTESFTAQELSEMCDQAFKRFYIRPKQMFRKLLEIKNFGDMARKLKAGWEIFKL